LSRLQKFIQLKKSLSLTLSLPTHPLLRIQPTNSYPIEEARTSQHKERKKRRGGKKREEEEGKEIF
jgi:hypothetical protein